MTEWYGEDLAYIHDVGHAGFALEFAPGILDILVRSGIQGGPGGRPGLRQRLVARKLTEAGYHVLGINIAEAMIKMARGKVSEAEFRAGSLFEADFPACGAVTAVSEVLSYLFDTESGDRGFIRPFRRVYQALVSGGVFVFVSQGRGRARGGHN